MSTILEIGFWISIPLAGRIALIGLLSDWDNFTKERVVLRFVITAVAGIGIWSVPLLLEVILGGYNSLTNGVAGWIISILSIYLLKRKLSFKSLQKPFLWQDILFVAGLLIIAFMSLAYPHESVLGGRDQGVYANSAIYIAQHGNLFVHFPFLQSNDYKEGFLPGLYNSNGSTLTVQFSHLLSVWLAEAYSTAGIHGLLGLNAVFGLLSLIIVRSVFEEFVGKGYAVFGVLLLGFNVSQIWMMRITLTEIFTQMLIFTGILFIIRALKSKDQQAALAGVSGFFFGSAVLCRIDSLLLLPLLIFACCVYFLFRDSNKMSDVNLWRTFFLVYGFMCALSIGYYYFFSRPYFLDLFPSIRLMLLMATLLAIVSPIVLRMKSGLLKMSKWLFYVLAIGIATVFLYGHLVRPFVGDGDYKQYTIVLLSDYLSIPVVYLGLFGLIMAIKKVIIKRDISWAVPLLLVAGFAGLYLYDPNISPGQFWGNRRFIPVVFPGWILFAFYATQNIYITVKPRVKGYILKTLTSSLYLYISILTIYNLVPIAFYHEQKGAWTMAKDLADSIPDNSLLLASEETIGYSTPLYMSFSKKVIPLGQLKDEGINKVNSFITQEYQGELYYITKLNISQMLGYRLELIKRTEFISSNTEITTITLPRKTNTIDDNIYIYKLIPEHDIWTIDASTTFGLSETGLYPLEVTNSGQYFRWTQGEAVIQITKKLEFIPNQLKINLVFTGPDEQNLSIKVNDQVIYEGRTTANEINSKIEIPLTDVADLDKEVKITIDSDTWSPVDTGSADSRKLGVAIGQIQLLRSEASQ